MSIELHSWPALALYQMAYFPSVEVHQFLGGDSIDILDGLNPSLNPSLLNHFSIQCLPKRVLNLVFNPSLDPSPKF